MRIMKISNIQDILYLILLGALFFANSVVVLDTPGFGDEEAFLVNPAVCMVDRNVQSRYLGWPKPYRRVLLMTNAWVGPVTPLLYVPSLFVFGPTVTVIRLTRIMYGFFTVALLFLFAKSFFDRNVAYLAAFLLATFPFFIFLSRQGFLDDGILPALVLTALLFFYAFYQNGKNKFFYWGAFFTGIGVCSKITFLWFIGALTIVALFLKIKVTLRKKNIFIGILLFTVATSPVIIFNAIHIDKWNRTEGSTIGAVVMNLTVTGGDTNNLKFNKNCLVRYKQLRGIFNNRFCGQRIKTHPFYFNLFLVSLGCCALRLIVFRKDAGQAKLKFILMLFLIFFVFSCFTINFFKIEHGAIYLPFAVLIIAYFLSDIRFFKFLVAKALYWAAFFNIRSIKFCSAKILCWVAFFLSASETTVTTMTVMPPRRKTSASISDTTVNIGITIAIVAVTIFNYATLIESYKILYWEGHYPAQFNWTHPSSEVYSLSKFLVEKGISRPLVIGSELTANVSILTRGAVEPRTCLGYGGNYAQRKAYLLATLEKEDDYYLILLQPFVKSALDVFEGILMQNGKTIDIVKIFYTKYGQPNIALFKVKNGNYNYLLSRYQKMKTR